MNTRPFLALALLLATAGCEDAISMNVAADRGPIGKADLVGTCTDACDGPSLTGNCWCDDLCESFGDCCDDKEPLCEASFTSFKIGRGGFCPPEMDCSGSIELLVDGTLILDRMGEPQGGNHIATISAEDLTAAIATLTAADLLELLDDTDPPCSLPTDIHESMTLEDGDGTHRNSTTFCNLDPIRDAREVLDGLASKYIPAVTTFERLEVFRGGFCPPEMDCTSRIELFADGTLRVDRMGELGGPVHEAAVSDDDLADVIAVVTDPDLLALLDSGDQACDPPTDVFESMTVVDAGGEHRAGITFCNLPEINAAEQAIDDLINKYLP